MAEALTPKIVADALSRHPREDLPALPGRSRERRAGVLVPLVWDPELTVVLTERPRSLRLHAGEIVFPGGSPEPGDADLEATALREANEELGLVGAQVLGELSSVPIYTSEFRLVPFVAAAPSQPFFPQESEVAAVLRVPVSSLFASGWTHAIAWRGDDGEESLSPVFDLEDRLVFGGTAHVLHELLQVLGPLLGAPALELRTGRFTWPEVFKWGTR
jgi:8-oxo-dGTP pyrophosphatase MutT (NUDIX family)